MIRVTLEPMELVSRLFGEAWEYRRRRHQAIAVGVLLVMVAVAAGLFVGRHQNVPTQNSSKDGYRPEPSRSVINSSVLGLRGAGAFQRVWIDVGLNNQATKVIASFDGEAVDLHTRGLPRGTPSAQFVGSRNIPNTFRPRPGVPSGHSGLLTVGLKITYADGSRVSTSISAHFKHGLALR